MLRGYGEYIKCVDQRESIIDAIRRFTIALLCMGTLVVNAQTNSPVKVNWDHSIMTVKSTPTLQVVVNPMLRRGSKIHDQAFDAVKQLQADYVRYVPWLPYPKLAVAELEPPTKREKHPGILA